VNRKSPEEIVETDSLRDETARALKQAVNVRPLTRDDVCDSLKYPLNGGLIDDAAKHNIRFGL
jgi:hypothetical protein